MRSQNIYIFWLLWSIFLTKWLVDFHDIQHAKNQPFLARVLQDRWLINFCQADVSSHSSLFNVSNFCSPLSSRSVKRHYIIITWSYPFDARHMLGLLSVTTLFCSQMQYRTIEIWDIDCWRIHSGSEVTKRNPRWRNKRAKDYRLYYEIGGFLQILPSLCFETHPIKFYGKEKHNAKILSIYLSKFHKKSQNYPSIKVHAKWSLGEFKRFIAKNTALC